MQLNTIEERYRITLPPAFHTLFDNGMLDWMGGHPDPLPEGIDWKRDIYPKLHEDPPALFHTGGDLMMFSPEKILSYPLPQEWDTDTYTIVPFAKGAEGNLYALFQSPKSGDDVWVAMIWEDEDEAEILARSMTDFVFRRMFEAADEADREDIDREYRGEDPIESYRIDILRDLVTITPYLPTEYVKILDDLYHSEVGSTMVSYFFKGSHSIESIVQDQLDFEGMGEEYEIAQ
jgi:hypothetical protein